MIDYVDEEELTPLRYVQLAKVELNRAEHLFFVSLKYTKTVEVVENIFDRMINTYESLVNALIQKEIEKGKASESLIKASPIEKVSFLKDQFSHDTTIHENLNTFLLLRKILKNIVDHQNSYRKNFTVIAMVGRQEYRIDLKKIGEFYYQLEDFWNYVKEKVASG